MGGQDDSRTKTERTAWGEEVEVEVFFSSVEPQKSKFIMEERREDGGVGGDRREDGGDSGEDGGDSEKKDGDPPSNMNHHTT